MGHLTGCVYILNSLRAPQPERSSGARAAFRPLGTFHDRFVTIACELIVRCWSVMVLPNINDTNVIPAARIDTPRSKSSGVMAARLLLPTCMV